MRQGRAYRDFRKLTQRRNIRKERRNQRHCGKVQSSREGLL